MAPQLDENLVQFRAIILSLLSYTAHPKLDTLITKLTPKLADSTRFLIKMEIRRLAKPCTLVMDFRSYFEDCQPIKHQNLCHYLDKISKELFIASVEQNDGLYNVHAYNELSEKAKNRHRTLVNTQEDAKQRSKIIVEDIQQISLVNSNFFSETPVNAESKCRLFGYDPLGMSYKGKITAGIEVTALDINANGCVIKTPLKAITNNDQRIYLWFYDHDNSLDFQQEIVLEYSIEDHKKIRSGKCSHYLLKLNQCSNSTMLAELKTLLTKRLALSHQSQKKQIPPLIASINAKCYEQFLLSNTVDIPMLCAEYQTGWRPSTSLKTPSNQELWQFLSDSTGHEPLTRLFAHPSIQNALNNQKEFDDYAYLLKHEYCQNIKNHQQFIIIWQSQLEDDYAASSFLAKYILNGDYRYIRLKILPVDAQQDAYVPSAIPDYINPAMALLNRPHNKQTLALLKASKQLAILSDVTELNNILAIPSALTVKENKRPKAQALKCPTRFSLASSTRKSMMEVVSINNDDLRVEDRFEHEIKLTLTHCNNKNLNLNGVSINISTSGLLIKLDKAVKIKAGTNIHLTMQVPYRGKILSLANQAYQLLASQDDRILRLAINGPKNKHLASHALREFIYQKMDELIYSGFEQNSVYGLQRAMRNIYANNHLSVPFFINQDKRQWHISSVAMNHHTKIHHFNDEEVTSQHMLLKMIEQEKFRNYCLALLNKVSNESPIEVFYIMTLPRKSPLDNQYSFWFSDIKQLQENGQLVDALNKIRVLKKPTILRIQLSKPNKIMDKYFRDELNYLEQISSSSAAELKDNMALMTGIGEITDHTVQVLRLFDNFINKSELANVS
jgi:hypothetical protein